MKFNWLLVLLFAGGFALNANAGPIFHLIGNGGIAPLHPNGDDPGDRMTISSDWGIAGTGGGFINARVIFRDGFELPAIAGGIVTFNKDDIDELFFDHSVPALGQPISPVIAFTALRADLSFASGTIVNEGGEIAMTNAGALGPPSFVTSLVTTRFAPGFGTVTGNWEMNASGLSLNGTNAGGAPLTPRLRVSNVADGRWELTGFTAASGVPEPGLLALMLPGALLLARFRRRRGLAPQSD